MRRIEIKGHTIELYDGIEEMPVARYHKFSQMMVRSAGIGSDIEAVKSKIFGIKQMLDDGENAKAKVELLNLYQTFFFIDTMTDPRSLAMACLVKTIDGKERDNISDDGLKETSALLDSWITKGERDEVTSSAKKKIESELAYYFPEHTDKGSGELAALMRREIDLRVGRIKAEADLEEKDPEIERVQRRIRALNYENTRYYAEFLRESDVAFEQGCLAITGELHKDAKQMSVMEYHSAMKLLDERAKELEKIKKK